MNPMIQLKRTILVPIISSALACFALEPALQAKPHPSPTPTPAPLGATLWYVPGVRNSYDQNDPPNLFAFAFFSVINPGTQSGTVTLTLRSNGTDVATASQSIGPLGETGFLSWNVLPPEYVHLLFVGYAVITSDVPVLINSDQEEEGFSPLHLDAYPAAP
jgi:hypothetical protein